MRTYHVNKDDHLPHDLAWVLGSRLRCPAFQVPMLHLINYLHRMVVNKGSVIYAYRHSPAGSSLRPCLVAHYLYDMSEQNPGVGAKLGKSSPDYYLCLSFTRMQSPSEPPFLIILEGMANINAYDRR